MFPPLTRREGGPWAGTGALSPLNPHPTPSRAGTGTLPPTTRCEGGLWAGTGALSDWDKAEEVLRGGNGRVPAPDETPARKDGAKKGATRRSPLMENSWVSNPSRAVTPRRPPWRGCWPPRPRRSSRRSRRSPDRPRSPAERRALPDCAGRSAGAEPRRAFPRRRC